MAAIQTMKRSDTQKEPAALIFSKAAGQKWTHGYACYTTTFFLLPSCGRLFYMCILQVQSYFEVKSILLICKGKEVGLLQMWQTSHYDDYCWDLMVSTIAISCKRFAGLRTARKEVNNTILLVRFQFYSISNDLNCLVIGNIGNLVHQSFHIFNSHRYFPHG